MIENNEEFRHPKNNYLIAVLLTIFLGPLGLIYTDKLLGVILLTVCLITTPFYLINIIVWTIIWAFAVAHVCLTLKDLKRIKVEPGNEANLETPFGRSE